MNLTDSEIYKIVSTALKDSFEAEKYVLSVRERLDEKELRGVLLAIHSAQHLKNISAEHGNSLYDTMEKIEGATLLDTEDRVYAKFMLMLLRASRVKESNVETKGNKPEDERCDKTVGVGFSAGGPSSVPRDYNAKHIEEEKEDKTQ